MGKTNKKIYEMNEEDFRNSVHGMSPFLMKEYGYYEDGKIKDIHDCPVILDLCKEFMSIDDFACNVLLLSDDDFSEDENCEENIDLDFRFDYSITFLNEFQELHNYMVQNCYKEKLEEYDFIYNKPAKYSGKYKEFNELLSRMICKSDFAKTSEYNKINKSIKERQSIPKEAKKYSEFLNAATSVEPSFFWRYINTLVCQDMWNQSKQIYTLNKNLALDFFNQDKLTIPYNALKHLDYKVFYLDFSNIKSFIEDKLTYHAFSIEGVLVRVIKGKDHHFIYLHLHFKKGSENYFVGCMVRVEQKEETSFVRTKPFGEELINFKLVQQEDNQKELETKVTEISLCDNFLVNIEFVQDVYNQRVTEEVEERTGKTFFGTYYLYLKNYNHNLATEELLHDVFSPNLSKDELRNTIVNSLGYSCCFEDYYSKECLKIQTELRKYKDKDNINDKALKEASDFLWYIEGVERITLCTLFYLGCDANRRLNKNKEIKREYEYIYKESVPVKEKKFSSLGDNLNYLNLSQDMYDAKDGLVTRYIGIGSGRKLTKLRYTRGYFRHQWIGSRKDGTYHRDEELRYIEPYYSNPSGERVISTTVITG